MGNSIFSIGLSALNAAQQGLLVAGHNVSNAATPGYTRQQVVQSTTPAQATGSGFIGQGVQIDSVKRIYNQFLTNQVAQAKTESTQLDTYLSQMKQIDNLLADPSGTWAYPRHYRIFLPACRTLPPIQPRSPRGNPCYPMQKCW